MRRVSCVPDQLSLNKKKTDDGPRTAGEPVGGGARPSCRTPTGGGIQTEKIRGHSSQQRMEEGSGAELWEFVIAAETTGRPVHGCAEGWCKHGKILSHTEFKSSFIKAWQLDFSVRINIFLYLCLYFNQCLKSTRIMFQVQVNCWNSSATVIKRVFKRLISDWLIRCLCLPCRGLRWWSGCVTVTTRETMKHEPGSAVWATDECVYRLIRCHNTAQRFLTLADRILQLWKVFTAKLLYLSSRQSHGKHQKYVTHVTIYQECV